MKQRIAGWARPCPATYRRMDVHACEKTSQTRIHGDTAPLSAIRSMEKPDAGLCTPTASPVVSLNAVVQPYQPERSGICRKN